MPIKHVWFDFSDTIAGVNRNVHDGIKYGAFADLSGRPDSPERHEEYDRLFKLHGQSNSNVFAQEFGAGAKFWSHLIAQGANQDLYELADERIPEILPRLASLVRVSIFSNVDTEDIMRSLGIDTSIFTHILSSSQLQHPKPHQEGYQKVVELSSLPPDDILYIGDIEEKDILPAKAVGLKTGIIWSTSDEADYNFTSFQDVLTLIENNHED